MEGAIGPKIKSKISIEIDIVTGRIEAINEDEMSFIEVIGALEYAKMMFYKDWMETSDS